jgi:hypothetical protein
VFLQRLRERRGQRPRQARPGPRGSRQRRWPRPTTPRGAELSQVAPPWAALVAGTPTAFPLYETAGEERTTADSSPRPRRPPTGSKARHSSRDQPAPSRRCSHRPSLKLPDPKPIPSQIAGSAKASCDRRPCSAAFRAGWLFEPGAHTDSYPPVPSLTPKGPHRPLARRCSPRARSRRAFAMRTSAFRSA